MPTAGGRLFVDMTDNLATPAGRHMILNVLGKSDPLIRDALTTIVERGDFIPELSEENKDQKKAVPLADFQTLRDYDPTVVPEMIRRSEASIAELKQNIQTKSGTALFDFIVEDTPQLRQGTHDPQGFGVIMTGMNAASWINEKMYEWLREKECSRHACPICIKQRHF